MEAHAETTRALDPSSLIGTWRRFGTTGPVYEILGESAAGTVPAMRVRVLETGEEVDYGLAHIVEDRRAR